MSTTLTINGEAFHLYTIDYRHHGHTYCVDLWALDDEDAKARLRSIAGNGEITGPIIGRFPAGYGLGWWAKFRCFVGNLFRTP